MRKFTVIFLSVILAACGGGGNDSPTAATPAPMATQAPADTAPTVNTTPATPAPTTPVATTGIQLMVNQVVVADVKDIYLIRSGDIVTLQATSGLSSQSSGTVDANGAKAITAVGIRTLSSTKYEFSLTGAVGNVTTITFPTLGQSLKFQIV